MSTHVGIHVGMKKVRNSRKKPLTIPATSFFLPRTGAVLPRTGAGAGKSNRKSKSVLRDI